MYKQTSERFSDGIHDSERLVWGCTDADPPQNWYVISRVPLQETQQFWAEFVKISQSYDQNDFSLVTLKENDRKNRDFRKIISRLYRRIFNFFLHRQWEYDVFLPIYHNISWKSMKHEF